MLHTRSTAQPYGLLLPWLLLLLLLVEHPAAGATFGLG
jgi:hypothetical protein